jgi:peptidoglycan/LPS O-acetylase OafA/YrhL
VSADAEAPAKGYGDTRAFDTRQSELNRPMPGLDGLRGIAILGVVTFHFSPLLRNSVTGPFSLLVDLIQRGVFGVDLFFALSGFLITGILLDTKQASNYFSSFYTRRILRIFPLYYGSLALWFFVLPRFLGPANADVVGSDRQIWCWLYITNWQEHFGRSIGYLMHLWSLSIEEQFYLLWPIVVYMLSPRQLLRACLVVCIFSLGVRVAFIPLGFSLEDSHRLTPAQLDTLAMGGAVAVLLRDPQKYRIASALCTRWATLVVALLFSATAVALHGFKFDTRAVQTIGYTVMGITFSWLILVTVVAADRGGIWQTIVRSGFLRSLGKYSYGIYLFHYPICAASLNYIWGSPRLRSLGSRSPALGVAWLVAGIAASYILAFLSWHVYERRFLILKPYFAARLARSVIRISPV